MIWYQNNKQMADTFFREVVWSCCQAGTEDEEEEEEATRETPKDREVRWQRAWKREMRLLQTQTKMSCC